MLTTRMLKNALIINTLIRVNNPGLTLLTQVIEKYKKPMSTIKS